MQSKSFQDYELRQSIFLYPNKSRGFGNMSLALSPQYLNTDDVYHLCPWDFGRWSSVIPMSLKYVPSTCSLYKARIYEQMGYPRNEQRVNGKLRVKQGQDMWGLEVVCTTRFSSFMDLGNRVSLGEKSLGIYIFGLTSSQINLIIQQFNQDLLYIS